MKIEHYIPRRAFVVFFWLSLATAFVCLMQDNEHGRNAIGISLRAFGPYALISALIATGSFRVFRSMRKGK